MLGRGLLLFCGFMVSANSLAVAASDDKESSTELRVIKEQIQQYERAATKAGSKAAKVTKEIEKLKSKMVTTAAMIQEYELSLNNLEAELLILKKKESQQKRYLLARYEQIQILLGSLEMLARNPGESLLAAPLPPKDMAKAAVLMRSTVPILQNSAVGLRTELQKLVSLQQEILAKQAQIKTTYVGMSEKQALRNKLLIQKKQEEAKLLNFTERTTRRISELNQKAKNIEEIIRQKTSAQKEHLPNAEEPTEYLALTGQFAKAKGMLPMPVTGQIASKFGADSGNGMYSKGITIRTREGAQVICPYDGEVIFAGFLKGYGKVLIVEHADNYFTTLTGFGELTAREGETLLAGEPVGTMAEDKAGELYLEIRHGYQSLDPLQWLAQKG